MTLPQKIGIESHITDDIVPREGTLRVRFRIDNSWAGPADCFPGDQQLAVTVEARVYDLGQVSRSHTLPSPVATGPRVPSTAHVGWTPVEIQLPPMAPGRYGVIAKVLGADSEFTGPFDPSNCFLREVAFGERYLMDLETLRMVYGQQTGNPLAEAAIRNIVQRGEVFVRGAGGEVSLAVDDGGELKIVPLREGRSAS